MITKTAENMLNKEASLGAFLGAARSANLSDAQKAELRKRYGLSEDSNLILRNAGRGFVGGGLGTLLGTAISTTPAILLASHGRMDPDALRWMLKTMPLAPIAGMAGAYMATNKYSPANARNGAEK